MNKSQDISKELSFLFSDWCGTEPLVINQLPQSGSYRYYFRLETKNKTAIGVYNEDKKENKAYLEFSKHFLSKSINVPAVFKEDLDKNCYLIEDLGDTTLFSYVLKLKQENKWDKIESLYKNILNDLLEIQIEGSKGINYSLCYPRDSFDLQSMQWDLSYFKYHFLKVAKIPFDEQKLEDDFNTLAQFLLQADTDFFLFRDFQSRNIMLKNESELYYIDFQGGRKGALQYDVASLLFESKLDLPFELRERLVFYYINLLKEKCINTSFKDYYYPYVLIRLLQAMGAYGFRGLIEKKSLFIQSIPFVIKSLKWMLKNVEFKIQIPEIIKVLQGIINSEPLNSISEDYSKLTVKVTSFSYKKGGVPDDYSGNGGGHVFDCRHLLNPGRYNEYKKLTGKDKPVVDFLEEKNDTKEFIENITKIIDQAIENYLERGFLHLMVSFGCTGGQHRSVFSAEKINAHLLRKYKNKLTVVLKHRELS